MIHTKLKLGQPPLQMEHPSWYPIFIKILPDLQALHGDPKFEQLLANVIKN